MADAMVTARMPHRKKEAGAKVLADLGISASQAINELYDYLLKHKALPFRKEEPQHKRIPQEKIDEARAWLASFPKLELDEEFRNLTWDEMKQRKLIEKGLATKEDFE